MVDNLLQQAPRDAATEPAPETAEPSDGQLLTAYLGQKDKAAFEALVHRHGPLIFGVCHRMLGNADDAADSFQAVFLVLVRKAASIRRPETLRAWLYSAAVRTSLKARGLRRRRMLREKEAAIMPGTVAASQVAASGVASEEELAVLDEELRALPEKYQLPVILCELEGRTRREAAKILRLPEGTVSSRLATARQKLAGRLKRRGVAVSLAGLGVLLAPSVASASMPATLAASTVEAATLYGAGHVVTSVASANVAALTQGVLNGMLLAKIKAVAIVALLLGVFAAGAQIGLAPDGDTDFYYDFRGSRPVPEALELFPPDGTAEVTPEDAGLRIKARTLGGQTFGWGVSTRFGLKGDFEVTATYELVTVDPPIRGGGAGVALNIAPDHERRKWAKLGRTFKVMEGNGHTAAFWDKGDQQARVWVAAPVPAMPMLVDDAKIQVIEVHPVERNEAAEKKGPETEKAAGRRARVRDGAALRLPQGFPGQEVRIIGAQGVRVAVPEQETFEPADTTSGQLRLVREGSLLRYLVADEPGKEFREIRRQEFGAEDIGLVRFVVNNNSSPTSVDARLVDLRIRTTRKTAASNPNASPPTAEPDGPARPAQRARTWWWLAALLALLTVLAMIALWMRRARRNNHSAAAAANGPPSGPHAVVEFPCPSCGKRLKRSGDRSGRKLQCPACQATFAA